MFIIGGVGRGVLGGIQKAHVLFRGHLAVGLCQLMGHGDRILIKIRIVVGPPDIGTEMKWRDEQDPLGGKALQQKIEAFACAGGNLRGRGVKTGLAVIGPQHEDGGIQRRLGLQELRQGRITAKPLPGGVLKHGRPAVAAFLQDADIGILQLCLKQTGPTDALWKTVVGDGIVSPGVGIAIAEKLLHRYTPPLFIMALCVKLPFLERGQRGEPSIPASESMVPP